MQPRMRAKKSRNISGGTSAFSLQSFGRDSAEPRCPLAAWRKRMEVLEEEEEEEEEEEAQPSGSNQRKTPTLAKGTRNWSLPDSPPCMSSEKLEDSSNPSAQLTGGSGHPMRGISPVALEERVSDEPDNSCSPCWGPRPGTESSSATTKQNPPALPVPEKGGMFGSKVF
ncbi:hypothetical protein JRQ81_008574 [Phrynocephalus forsythii]|uniref:Uncharacterized protein n=1 Tax=Phrynocephalus forsythii TaxID=171643 RepID=A0A9Q0XCA9_9SAUR|nr:hypothetical protein JRQ81_008574 [Phrynocephalus forsythii]